MLNAGLWYRSFGLPEDQIRLESHPIGSLASSSIRVRMSLAPINPSDLIPITGAYRHRIELPCVAGYEGVGIVEEAKDDFQSLLGKRVLAIRGAGTWQQYVDCNPRWAVPVPEDIDDTEAAMAYINPLSAMLMLRQWKPRGKNILLTAAGSSCAALIARWAAEANAESIVGVYRSAEHRSSLERRGVVPVRESEIAEITQRSRGADLIFDAVGGPLGSLILQSAGPAASFVSYGSLSNLPLVGTTLRVQPARFHLRDQLKSISEQTWQTSFQELWRRLRNHCSPETTTFPFQKWKEALAWYRVPGRKTKPLLSFTSTH